MVTGGMRKTPAGSLWTTIGVFAVVGPYVGGLIMGLAILHSRFGRFGDEVTLGDILTLPLMGFLGYPFGFAPAAITGYISGLASAYVTSKPGWIALSTVTGTTISLLFFAAISENLEGSLPFAAVGGIAALVSAFVGLKVRPRWSN